MWYNIIVYHHFSFGSVKMIYVLYPPPSLGEGKFLAFLYNDEVHSYDEVIHTLTHNVKLQHSDAVALATFVDRKVLLSLSLPPSLPPPLSVSIFSSLYRVEL